MQASQLLGNRSVYFGDPGTRSIAEQYRAAHELIRQLGPGTVAQINNYWQATDVDGRPRSNADGSPKLLGGHGTIAFYPDDGSAGGPIWYDPMSPVWYDPMSQDHGPPEEYMALAGKVNIVVGRPDLYVAALRHRISLREAMSDGAGGFMRYQDPFVPARSGRAYGEFVVFGRGDRRGRVNFSESALAGVSCFLGRPNFAVPSWSYLNPEGREASDAALLEGARDRVKDYFGKPLGPVSPHPQSLPQQIDSAYQQVLRSGTGSVGVAFLASPETTDKTTGQSVPGTDIAAMVLIYPDAGPDGQQRPPVWWDTMTNTRYSQDEIQGLVARTPEFGSISFVSAAGAELLQHLSQPSGFYPAYMFTRESSGDVTGEPAKTAGPADSQPGGGPDSGPVAGVDHAGNQDRHDPAEQQNSTRPGADTAVADVVAPDLQPVPAREPPMQLIDPAQTRFFGPGFLAGLEDPGLQTTLENMMRTPDGEFARYADPSTFPSSADPYGARINPGFGTAVGRAANCVDCVQSGLATFLGLPTTAVPTFPLVQNGVLRWEVPDIGNNRRQRWMLRTPWRGFKNTDLSIPQQFDAVHDMVRSLRPGSAAVVEVDFRVPDPASGGPNTSSPPPPSSHVLLVVYPKPDPAQVGADGKIIDQGPLWWDPQTGAMSRQPINSYVRATTRVRYVPIPPGRSVRAAAPAGRRPAPRQRSHAAGAPPPGPLTAPVHNHPAPPARLADPAWGRRFGVGGLNPTTHHPGVQRVLEDSLRDRAGNFVTGADPQTYPAPNLSYGWMINDGGIGDARLYVDEWDAALAGVSTFLGNPLIAMFRDKQSGTTHRERNIDGLNRALAWLRTGPDNFGVSRPVREQFEALHYWVAALGPGSAALAMRAVSATEPGTGTLRISHFEPVLVIYPEFGGDDQHPPTGPRWWRPSTNEYWDSPPITLIGGTTALTFIALPAGTTVDSSARNPAVLPAPVAAIDDGLIPVEPRQLTAIEPAPGPDQRSELAGDVPLVRAELVGDEPVRSELAGDVPLVRAELVGDEPVRSELAGDVPLVRAELVGDEPVRSELAGDVPRERAELAGDMPVRSELVGDEPPRFELAGDEPSRPEVTEGGEPGYGPDPGADQGSVDYSEGVGNEPTAAHGGAGARTYTGAGAGRPGLPDRPDTDRGMADSADQHRGRSGDGPDGRDVESGGERGNRGGAAVSELVGGDDHRGLHGGGDERPDPAGAADLPAADPGRAPADPGDSGPGRLPGQRPVGSETAGTVHDGDRQTDPATATDDHRRDGGRGMGELVSGTGRDLAGDGDRTVLTPGARSLVPVPNHRVPEPPEQLVDPATSRVFGPGLLAPLEDPALQTDFEDSMRGTDREFVRYADPSTYPAGGTPYGARINPGYGVEPGRFTNCLECVLSGLATFLGHPLVAAPRYPDTVNGVVCPIGPERNGGYRTYSILRTPVNSFDNGNRPVSEQFTALHGYVQSLGPGSAAVVHTVWQAKDPDTGALVYDAAGRPVPGTAHDTLLVYPEPVPANLDEDGNLIDEGPLWWDPQSGEMSHLPPERLTRESVRLEFRAIPPGPTIAGTPEAGRPDSGVPAIARPAPTQQVVLAPVHTRPVPPRRLPDPSKSRRYGHGRLAGLEHPALQTSVEQALRDDSGNFVAGADPATYPSPQNPYGWRINLGGPAGTGREGNKWDAALAGLASFLGFPLAAVPLHPNPGSGRPTGSDEAEGVGRACQWLQSRPNEFSADLDLPDQYTALHTWITMLGPGAAALVFRAIPETDPDTGERVRDEHGKTRISHFEPLVIGYPTRQSKDNPHPPPGPRWWDPANSDSWSHPPEALIADSAGLGFIVVPPGRSVGSALPGAQRVTELPDGESQDSGAVHRGGQFPASAGAGREPDARSTVPNSAESSTTVAAGGSGPFAGMGRRPGADPGLLLPQWDRFRAQVAAARSGQAGSTTQSDGRGRADGVPGSATQPDGRGQAHEVPEPATQPAMGGTATAHLLDSTLLAAGGPLSGVPSQVRARIRRLLSRPTPVVRQEERRGTLASLPAEELAVIAQLADDRDGRIWGELESPSYQENLEQALRRSGRTGFARFKDPRTFTAVPGGRPFGELINGPGRRGPGRYDNCQDTALSLFASLVGKPQVAAPRIGLAPGSLFTGKAQAQRFAGNRVITFAGSVRAQFRAAHRHIAALGPGTAVYVEMNWHATDDRGEKLYHADGSPRFDRGHDIIVVDPVQTGEKPAGPVWYDPQIGKGYSRPPEAFLKRAAAVSFVIGTNETVVSTAKHRAALEAALSAGGNEFVPHRDPGTYTAVPGGVPYGELVNLGGGFPPGGRLSFYESAVAGLSSFGGRPVFAVPNWDHLNPGGRPLPDEALYQGGRKLVEEMFGAPITAPQAGTRAQQLTEIYDEVVELGVGSAAFVEVSSGDPRTPVKAGLVLVHPEPDTGGGRPMPKWWNTMTNATYSHDEALVLLAEAGDLSYVAADAERLRNFSRTVSWPLDRNSISPERPVRTLREVEPDSAGLGTASDDPAGTSGLPKGRRVRYRGHGRPQRVRPKEWSLPNDFEAPDSAGKPWLPEGAVPEEGENTPESTGPAADDPAASDGTGTPPDEPEVDKPFTLN